MYLLLRMSFIALGSGVELYCRSCGLEFCKVALGRCFI